MINRFLTKTIIKYLNHFPAVAIIGPRQVGKTTLSKIIQQKLKKKSSYLDLERLEDLMKLENAAFYLENKKEECVILDEIQRRPELFPEMRSLIDRHRVPGRFLILGSASPDLIRQSSESLAGRITYLELTPFSLLEINSDEIEKLWIRGGFPEPFMNLDEEIRDEWFRSFISTYIERDLPMLGLNTSPNELRKFLSMISGIQGSILNMQMLSRSMGVSSTTVARYLEYLEKSFLLSKLPPYYLNIKKRLVKSPKIYIRDSGIYHALLGIKNMDQLIDNINIGASWESFAIEQIINCVRNDFQAWFYRTHEGTECDMLLTKNAIPVSCIEMKNTSVPKKSKSLTFAINDLKTENNFIVVPKLDEAFKLSEKITVCNLIQFVNDFLPEL